VIRAREPIRLDQEITNDDGYDEALKQRFELRSSGLNMSDDFAFIEGY
jgi:hypothetical protein